MPVVGAVNINYVSIFFMKVCKVSARYVAIREAKYR